MTHRAHGPSHVTPSVPSEPRLPVVFNVWQTGNLANGGVESITQVLTRLRTIRPTVVTQRETPSTERWRRAGLEVIVLPDDARGSGPRALSKAQRLARTNRAMFELVRARGAKVVHNNDIRAHWMFALGARAAGARVVFNVRDVKAGDAPYARSWSVARGLADHVLVLSSEMARAIDGRVRPLPFVRGGDVGSIYSVVDFARVDEVRARSRDDLRRELGIGGDRIALAYVATINAKKAQLAFLERAARLVLDLDPRIHLYFLGDFDTDKNPYARECARAVARLGVEARVTFVGYSRRVIEWYRAADVTVLASQREGLARCMIESVAVGTPVVSFDVCSAREILERFDAGRVVRQGDYDAFARSVRELVERPRLRDELGARGRAAARKLFDPEVVVREYESLYARLAADARGGVA